MEAEAPLDDDDDFFKLLLATTAVSPVDCHTAAKLGAAVAREISRFASHKRRVSIELWGREKASQFVERLTSLFAEKILGLHESTDILKYTEALTAFAKASGNTKSSTALRSANLNCGGVPNGAAAFDSNFGRKQKRCQNGAPPTLERRFVLDNKTALRLGAFSPKSLHFLFSPPRTAFTVRVMAPIASLISETSFACGRPQSRAAELCIRLSALILMTLLDDARVSHAGKRVLLTALKELLIVGFPTGGILVGLQKPSPELLTRLIDASAGLGSVPESCVGSSSGTSPSSGASAKALRLSAGPPQQRFVSSSAGDDEFGHRAARAAIACRVSARGVAALVDYCASCRAAGADFAECGGSFSLLREAPACRRCGKPVRLATVPNREAVPRSTLKISASVSPGTPSRADSFRGGNGQCPRAEFSSRACDSVFPGGFGRGSAVADPGGSRPLEAASDSEEEGEIAPAPFKGGGPATAAPGLAAAAPGGGYASQGKIEASAQVKKELAAAAVPAHNAALFTSVFLAPGSRVSTAYLWAEDENAQRNFFRNFAKKCLSPWFVAQVAAAQLAPRPLATEGPLEPLHWPLPFHGWLLRRLWDPETAAEAFDFLAALFVRREGEKGADGAEGGAGTGAGGGGGISAAGGARGGAGRSVTASAAPAAAGGSSVDHPSPHSDVFYENVRFAAHLPLFTSLLLHCTATARPSLLTACFAGAAALAAAAPLKDGAVKKVSRLNAAADDALHRRVLAELAPRLRYGDGRAVALALRSMLCAAASHEFESAWPAVAKAVFAPGDSGGSRATGRLAVRVQKIDANDAENEWGGGERGRTDTGAAATAAAAPTKSVFSELEGALCTEEPAPLAPAAAAESAAAVPPPLFHVPGKGVWRVAVAAPPLADRAPRGLAACVLYGLQHAPRAEQLRQPGAKNAAAGADSPAAAEAVEQLGCALALVGAAAAADPAAAEIEFGVWRAGRPSPDEPFELHAELACGFEPLPAG